jgi:4-amino-4-deoxy-L-arabinose transferase-like glycosyltransferase
MEKQFSKIYPQQWTQIAILIGFCLILFFFNLNRWDLWNPDEPRYAEVSREIVKGGDWILMHYNGKVYGDKPPLFFWLIALSSYLWKGFSSFAVRFPSAFFGTLTVLLVFFLGKILYGIRTGFLSGLILATSVEFAYLSTRANIDTTLTFFTTASFFCFFKWLRYRNKEEYRQRKLKSLFIYGFYVSMAFATLTKGPVGFILPLLVTLIYLLIQKDWKGMKEMKLPSGLFLFLVIVSSWYLLAIWKGGQSYLEETLLTHTLNRFSKGWSKPRPIYYYLANFPLDYLPWFLFLPAAMVLGFSKEMLQKRKEFLFLLTWFAVIFLFFSFSKGKRGLYLLPLFPAASLMVGKLWDDLMTTPMDKIRREWISVPLYGFMGATLIGGAAIPWIVSMRFHSFFLYSLPMAFLMIGGSVLLFVLYRFRDLTSIFFLILGMIATGYFYTSLVIFPMVNPYKSARFMSQEITSRIQSGEKLGLYGSIGAGPFNFYTGIYPIAEFDLEKDLIYFLQSEEKVYCLIRLKEFSALHYKEGWPKVHVITQRRIGNDEILLVSNK